MKIAIPCLGETLGSPVDPQFWRASFFQTFNEVGNQDQILKNPYAHSPEDSEMLAVQFLIENAITTLIVEDIGPDLFRILQSAGMKIFLGPSGCNVREFIDKYLKKELDELKGANLSPR